MNIKGKAAVLTPRHKLVKRRQIQQHVQPLPTIQEQHVQPLPTIQEQHVQQKQQVQYTRNTPLMKFSGTKRNGIKMPSMIYSNGRFGGG
jgi:hypothetical protein